MDPAELLHQIRQFGRAGLHRVETKYTTEEGVRGVETIDAAGRAHFEPIEGADRSLGFVEDFTPDLQVGEVMPGLLLASVDAVGDLDLLTSLKVTHILCVASSKIEYFPNRFSFLHVATPDLPQTDIIRRFPQCFRFISAALASGGCVLVHCMAGKSRSATIVIGYVMAATGEGWERALERVKAARPTIRPNDGFMAQLKGYRPSGGELGGVGEEEEGHVDEGFIRGDVGSEGVDGIDAARIAKENNT